MDEKRRDPSRCCGRRCQALLKVGVVPLGQGRYSLHSILCTTGLACDILVDTKKKKTVVRSTAAAAPAAATTAVETYERLQRNLIQRSIRVSTKTLRGYNVAELLVSNTECCRRAAVLDIRHAEKLWIGSSGNERSIDGHARRGDKKKKLPLLNSTVAGLCKNRNGNQPAVPARSSGVVDKPREGGVVDGVPNGEDHVAYVEVAVADLQRVYIHAGGVKSSGPCEKGKGVPAYTPGVGVGLSDGKEQQAQAR